MNTIRFEWDEEKNRINRTKHGVDFMEAQTVFEDGNAVLIPDPDHSEQEERFYPFGIERKTEYAGCLPLLSSI